MSLRLDLVSPTVRVIPLIVLVHLLGSTRFIRYGLLTLPLTYYTPTLTGLLTLPVMCRLV